MTKQPNTNMSWEEEFDERFSFTQIFNTDNFEDSKYINHPCYSHAGIANTIRDFIRDTVIPQSQSNLIDQVIEWAEENNFLSSNSNDEGYAVSLSDLLNYLQKLKEKNA